MVAEEYLRFFEFTDQTLDQSLRYVSCHHVGDSPHVIDCIIHCKKSGHYVSGNTWWDFGAWKL